MELWKCEGFPFYGHHIALKHIFAWNTVGDFVFRQPFLKNTSFAFLLVVPYQYWHWPAESFFHFHQRNTWKKPAQVKLSFEHPLLKSLNKFVIVEFYGPNFCQARMLIFKVLQRSLKAVNGKVTSPYVVLHFSLQRYGFPPK